MSQKILNGAKEFYITKQFLSEFFHVVIKLRGGRLFGILKTLNGYIIIMNISDRKCKIRKTVTSHINFNGLNLLASKLANFPDYETNPKLNAIVSPRK